MKRTILVLLSGLSLFILVGCAKLKPEKGQWTGDIISFNVSDDCSKLTTSNSNLPQSCSLIIEVAFKPNRLGMLSANQYIYTDIPISGGKFEYKSDELTVTGTFTSPSEASGTYQYSDTVTNYPGGMPVTDTVRGSGTWKATR